MVLLSRIKVSYVIFFRGKNVLNQKSELQKALSKHKEKQILNQVKEHKETPGKNIFYRSQRLNVKVKYILSEYARRKADI